MRIACVIALAACSSAAPPPTAPPFAPAPGVEYVSDASCTGYRLITE